MKTGKAVKAAVGATSTGTGLGTGAAFKERGSLRLSGALSMLWGATLLWQGPAIYRLLQGHEPEILDDDAITVLAVRQLAQGTVQLIAPRLFGPLYVAVDALHAASMVALAVKQPQRRRVAITSGTVAALSCAASVRATLDPPLTRFSR